MLNTAQQAGGGDPFIGPKLEGLLRAAGFSSVDVQPVHVHGSAADPETLRASAEELAEIFESLDEALPDQAPLLHAAAREARALPQVPGAEFHYRPVAALGTR